MDLCYCGQLHLWSICSRSPSGLVTWHSPCLAAPTLKLKPTSTAYNIPHPFPSIRILSSSHPFTPPIHSLLSSICSSQSPYTCMPLHMITKNPEIRRKQKKTLACHPADPHRNASAISMHVPGNVFVDSIGWRNVPAQPLARHQRRKALTGRLIMGGLTTVGLEIVLGWGKKRCKSASFGCMRFSGLKFKHAPKRSTNSFNSFSGGIFSLAMPRVASLIRLLRSREIFFCCSILRTVA